MMKLNKLWLVAIIFLAFAAVSCDNEEEPVNEAQLLVEYLEGADGGYVANGMPAIKPANLVKTGNTAGTMYLIDVRSAEAYDTAHIEGAVNVPLNDVMSHLDETTDDDGKDVILICYSGQSAAWMTNICRAAGYDNVYSMGFGMSSWHSDFAGSWNGSVSNSYAAAFEDGDVAKAEAGDLPVLNTGKTTGEEILMARIDEVIADEFGGAAIAASAVFDNPENYYIVNYWADTDYAKYGHVPGAMQYTPGEMLSDMDLKTLPTDQTIVVYCWTGQTSANLACYLKLLGYDAKSLKFGANGMIHGELETHKWTETSPMEYDYWTPTK